MTPVRLDCAAALALAAAAIVGFTSWQERRFLAL